jgi:phytanoyl-CoA hydroxylase
MSLPETPFYMDLSARGKLRWKDCPIHLKSYISKFLDAGYVVLPNSVDIQVINSARKAFFEHVEKYATIYGPHRNQYGYFERLVNLHMALDQFKDIFTKNPLALEIQDWLFGQESACFTSLTFQSGSEQPIHRDSPYFTTYPEYYYLGVWVALESVNDQNGALSVIEGGHLVHEPDRFELIAQIYPGDAPIDPMDPKLWEVYQTRVAEMCQLRGMVAKTVSMEPGDTLIWHPHLPHGGSPIRDKTKSRFSMVNHVVPMNVPVGGMEHFYGRKAPLRSANYSYIKYDERNFLHHEHVEFAHTNPVPYRNFRL